MGDCAFMITETSHSGIDPRNFSATSRSDRARYSIKRAGSKLIAFEDSITLRDEMKEFEISQGIGAGKLCS